ncbi:MAG: sulfite exporter TauE/SafE family protein [Methyloligellaceae bacterium]
MILGLPLGEMIWLIGILLAAGIVTGLLAGLLGIGGGGILVPILYEVFSVLGVDESIRMHVSVGTSLAAIMPTSLRSFYAHKAKGAVDMEVVKSMLVPVVLGVCLGVMVARFSNENILKGIWAGAATLFSLKAFLGGNSWRLGDQIPGNPLRALYGIFIGTISTLMSIGGGAFITMMMTLYGRPIHQAVATSSGFGPMIAVPGTLGFIWAGYAAQGLPPGSLGYVNVLGAAVIVSASVLAAPVGVRIAHGISRRALELAFATFLAVVAIRFFWSML